MLNRFGSFLFHSHRHNYISKLKVMFWVLLQFSIIAFSLFTYQLKGTI